MSTALLALALLIGLGMVTFALALGLTGLGILLSWVFPLTPFQGTVIHVVLFVLALFLLGLTLLVERVKDALTTTVAEEEEEEEHLDEMLKIAGDRGRHAGVEASLPVRRTESKVGRNDPCPCGSGKKYKFCCLAKL